MLKVLAWLETAFTKMWMLPVFLLWMAVSVTCWLTLAQISLWIIILYAINAMIVTVNYYDKVSNTPEGSLALITLLMNPVTILWMLWDNIRKRRKQIDESIHSRSS